MKFSQIAKGPQQIEEIELPMVGQKEPVKIGLRVLLDEDDGPILKYARDYAIREGVQDPKAGDPIYDVALARASVAASCTDVDSPDKREPFFASPEQVKELDRDRIAYLFERQQVWQDACSPSSKSMGQIEFMAKVLEIAGAGDEDQSPFVSMRPAMLVSFTRTLAKQHMDFLMRKSLYGTDKSSSTESASKSPDEPQ